MIAPEARAALVRALGPHVRFDVPMARLTSLRVGGPADAVATPADRAELSLLLRTCHAARLPHLVLGGGFNTLALDGPLEAVVIQLGRFRRIEERPGGVLRVEAGVSHSQVARFCTQHGLAGLEFAAGIPGTVGGWLAMNAGVPGRELADVLVELEVMSPTGTRLRHLPASALRPVYRALRGLAPGSVFVSALLRVTPSTREAVQEEIARRRSRSRSRPAARCSRIPLATTRGA